MNKLTLSIDKKTVLRAKRIAAANGISISSMVRWFVSSVGANNKLPPAAIRFAKAEPQTGAAKKSRKR